MAESTPLAVLRAALPRLLAACAPTARIDVLRALPGVAQGTASTLHWRVEQSFQPLRAALQAEGLDTAPEGSSPPEAVIVLLPRSREEGRALLARALRDVAVGGVVAGAALNDEGARSAEKDLATLLPLAGQISKAHGRAFWTVPRPAVLPEATQGFIERWLTADAPRRDATTGLWQRPGVFNEGRLDGGSALLIDHLPPTLRGAVADLGAGTGLLSMAVLDHCPGVQSIDLFEAEDRALELARRNLAEARVPVHFHWHDVAAGVPGRFDAVVSNPPFHVGARSVPALGRAFIAAAARALKRDGQFLMVANRHLPYEDELRALFGRGELLAEQGGFKVYRAWEPKP
ncbi:class I SAM-dependent methyltransferase [Silanimonas sp.]|jgi:16S rRNA (guanine1207-N2)-methyltransferase|uniref:class I SAM-dependent methyltransferase n=1 Tax=Silanimonas sp. TaxID=1929290 RepID=UPI0037C8B849